jgi:hypothetical protein
LAVRRRHASFFPGRLAVFAALALLLTPVTASTGVQIPHAHALVHLLLDGADGSFDHHRLGHPGGGNADHAAGNHASPGPGEVAGSAAPFVGRSAAANPARADVASGQSPAPPDDLPVLTSLSVFATAAAIPLAGSLARLHAPAVASLLLAWGACRMLAGITPRPTSPPPRCAARI